jgi:hypothetical protein
MMRQLGLRDMEAIGRVLELHLGVRLSPKELAQVLSDYEI